MNSFLVSAHLLSKIIDKKNQTGVKSEDLRLVLSIAKGVYFDSLVKEKIEFKTNKKELKITPLNTYFEGNLKKEFREAKVRTTKEKDSIYWIKRLNRLGFLGKVVGTKEGIFKISLDRSFGMDVKNKSNGLYWLKLPSDINNILAGKNPYKAKTILSILRRINSINKGYSALKFNYYSFLCEIDSPEIIGNVSRFNKQIKDAFDLMQEVKILKGYKLPKIKNIKEAAMINIFIYFEPKVKPKK